MTGVARGPGPPILRGHPQNFVFMITLPFPPVASHKYDLVYLAPKLSRKFFSIPRERQVYPWTLGEDGADFAPLPIYPLEGKEPPRLSAHLCQARAIRDEPSWKKRTHHWRKQVYQ